MQVKTEEKNVNNKKLIPFWVIERALEGDIQAINKILKHYEGYIAKLSVRKMLVLCQEKVQIKYNQFSLFM